MYRHLEVNDGKGCNVREGHGRLCPLLGTTALKDNRSCSAFFNRALGGILADN